MRCLSDGDGNLTAEGAEAFAEDAEPFDEEVEP